MTYGEKGGREGELVAEFLAQKRRSVFLIIIFSLGLSAENMFISLRWIFSVKYRVLAELIQLQLGR